MWLCRHAGLPDPGQHSARFPSCRAWAALVGWLNEVGADGAAELTEPQWSTFEYRQSEEAIEHFARIFVGFASTRDKLDLLRRFRPFAKLQRTMS